MKIGLGQATVTIDTRLYQQQNFGPKGSKLTITIGGHTFSATVTDVQNLGDYHAVHLQFQ